jgi:hypothetical protein
MKAIL